MQTEHLTSDSNPPKLSLVIIGRNEEQFIRFATQFCLDAIPYVVSFVATLNLLLISVPLAIYFGFLWLVVSLAALIGAVLIIRKGGLHGAGLSIAVRSVSTYRTIVSYWKTRPKRIDEYPTDVIQVQ